MQFQLSLVGRVVKRNKGSRVAKVERQRAPYPLPRPGKVKSIHSRPSPLSRKRRYSGRAVRPPLQPANASEETDMAQADEMGEEGRDDGFIDGAVQEPFKRRSKKRAGKDGQCRGRYALIFMGACKAKRWGWYIKVWLADIDCLIIINIEKT